MNKVKTQKRKRLGALNITLLIVLTIYALSLVVLLLWGLSTSLKTLDDFYGNKIWLPSGNILTWGWDNYTYVLQNFAIELRDPQVGIIRVNMFGQAVNTIIYTVGTTLASTACCCLMSYLSAKFDYPFSKFLYTLVVIVMIIPIVGNTPSMLLLLKETNLYDNWLGTFIMRFTFGGVYFLIFHGVWEGISSEYAEAATIDGANEFQIFFVIMIPLVKTTIYTVFLITFIGHWNEYNWALMYMPTHPTLAYGVYHLSVTSTPGMSYAPMRMVACVILALPITIVFIIFREKLVGNTTAGGVKE